MGKNVKIVTFVPQDAADAVREAMGKAGAGALGDYRFCSWSVAGYGRFTPEQGAKPTIGEVGKAEVVAEDRIEVIVERSKAKPVIKALRDAHPYEEVAFDIIELLDEDEL